MHHFALDRLKNEPDQTPTSVIEAFNEWLVKLPAIHRRSALSQDFARATGVSPDQAEAMFCLAQDAGILRPVYSVFCPECEELVDSVHETIELDCEYTCFNQHSFVPAKSQHYVRIRYEALPLEKASSPD